MASTPDPHPDSIQNGPDSTPDDFTPAGEPGRENVEEPSPMEDPGSDGGTGGTGGTNHPQDHDVTS